MNNTVKKLILTVVILFSILPTWASAHSFHRLFTLQRAHRITVKTESDLRGRVGHCYWTTYTVAECPVTTEQYAWTDSVYRSPSQRLIAVQIPATFHIRAF